MQPQARPPQRTHSQEALADFILSFVQALLRTGYYLPDHPQAHKAKQGLHGHFHSLFQGRHELTFMVQDLGETKDILVEGALPETQKLKGLMAAGMAEVYVPRLSQFLERKDLVSLTLKEGMPEEEFSRFIDVMSEPGGAVLDAAGKERFVAHLRESGVRSFSLVFKDDLVAPERKLPWRAQLAISRLQKDFKHVPLFQKLDAKGLQTLRQQVLDDVLRPISRADLLAVILMNSDVAASREVSEEEIEDELVQFIPDGLVVPTGRAALKAHPASDPQAAPRQQRALLKLLLRPKAKDLPGVAELVRELFDRGLVDLERLPQALKAQVLLERETDRFLAERAVVLKRLEATPAPEAYHGRADALLRLIPELLRRNLLDDVLGLVTMLRGHAALGGPRAAIAEQALAHLAAGDVAATLKQKFLKGKKEDRVAVATLYQALGDPVRTQLLAIVREAQDGWVRKNASEILLRMGREATEMLLRELHGGGLPVGALPELLMVFGEIRSDAPAVAPALQQFARDRDPRVREEAAWALCRIRGAAEEGLFLHLLDDPDLEVRKRAIRCLRTARCGAAFGRVVELLTRVEREPALEPLEANLYAALPELAEASGSRGGPVEQLLVERLRQMQPQGLLAAFHRAKRPLSDEAFHAICDALAAIGTEPAREALSELSKRAREPARQRLLKALQKIEARR